MIHGEYIMCASIMLLICNWWHLFLITSEPLEISHIFHFPSNILSSLSKSSTKKANVYDISLLCMLTILYFTTTHNILVCGGNVAYIPILCVVTFFYFPITHDIKKHYDTGCYLIPVNSLLHWSHVSFSDFEFKSRLDLSFQKQKFLYSNR